MMKKAVMQFTACCLAVGITLGSFGTVAFADNNRSMTLAGLSETNTVVSSSSTLAGLSETDTVVSTGGAEGATTVSDTAAVSETADEEAGTADTDTGDDTTDVDETSAETEAQTETEAVYDTSMSGEVAFAQCENYINVRAEASVDGEVVGKVYNNGSVTILGQLGDWYEVQSGNVTGYVNAAYFATGEEAEEIAEAVAYNVATVNAEGLWVHSEASEDSSTIGMVYSSDQLEVVAYEGDWMKVVLDDGTYGYINAWYVSYDTYYSTAETLEEEQERLDEQWLAYLAEQEAEAAAAEAAAEAAAAEAAAATTTDTSSSTSSSSTGSSSTSSSSTSLSEAEAAVDEAYQTYLEAQEAADAATQQADEQLVYDTYDEAVAAYQDYLSAVAVADEIKYSSTTETTTTTTDTSSSETTYTEATATTETTYTEAAQTEAAQTEAVQTTSTEATTTTTSSSSSSTTGQAIANYAVQFVGNPYVYGGTSLTNGADCSGFTQSVFANFGISIPRTAAAQASSGTSVSLSDIQAGDLLFYSDGSGISHVALYIGNGQVVHASTSSTGIIISNYNYRTPVCARRYWS